jgi:predicted helicase
VDFAGAGGQGALRAGRHARQTRTLGLVEVLGWAADALNRVDREAFFAAFDEADAVQHFYEPFLAAYDPDLRRALGVWYTPPEIVRYMVERVDGVLRERLGIADGLADPNVWVLDPCTGTGSYLVEVLRRIRRTLEDKGVGAALGAELKEAATRRIAGFELLPAPFVIAHWQVATLLADAGAKLDLAAGERASVYLTNALTGWEPGGVGPHLPFPQLERERDLANGVKREAPVLVIIGNPPYSAFDGTSPAQEGDLVERTRRACASAGASGSTISTIFMSSVGASDLS